MSSNASKLRDSLFDTMKIFSEKAASSNGATITIEGQVKSIIDEAKGEYMIDYLGNAIPAHSKSSEKYQVGDNIYVLVPDGDFAKEKIILGYVVPNLDSIIKTAESNIKYINISDNLINKSFSTIELSSYEETESEDMFITTQSSEEYGRLIKALLEDSRLFSFGFRAKTALALEQQCAGNYGITLKIPVIEQKSNNVTEETYKIVTLDTLKMLGNYYRFEEPSNQIVYFQLEDKYTYDSSRSILISYFCNNFHLDASKIDIKDIFLDNLSFYCVKQLAATDTIGYVLSLEATHGNYFASNYNTTKTITPTLKIDGKVTSLEDVPVYWFKEDVGITTNSEDYVVFGGIGWKCLNEKVNTITNEDGTKTYEYNTSIKELKINAEDVYDSVKYKCVILYNVNSSTKEQIYDIIKIKNLNPKAHIELSHTNGDGYTTGDVDITLKVYIQDITDSEKDFRNNVTTSWSRENKDGELISGSFLSVEPFEIGEMEFEGKKLKCYTLRATYPSNIVNEKNTVYCTVKYNKVITNAENQNLSTFQEILIGTEKLNVHIGDKKSFNLIINGDNVIYKYDSDGDSPTNPKTYNGAISNYVEAIKSLTFTLYKDDGTELSDTEYASVEYEWKIANDEGNIKPLIRPKATPTEIANGFKYYRGKGNDRNFAYSIADKYDQTGAENSTLTLTTKFADDVFTRNAVITFVKEGANGTNGTKYTCTIVTTDATNPTADSGYRYGEKGIVKNPKITITEELKRTKLAKKLKFVYNIDDEKLYEQKISEEDGTTSLKECKLGISDSLLFARVWENNDSLIYNDTSRTDLDNTVAKYDIEWSMFDEDFTNPCFEVYPKEGEKDKDKKFLSTECIRLKLNKIPDIITAGDEQNVIDYPENEKFNKIIKDKQYCNIVQAKITPRSQDTGAPVSKQTVYCYYPIEITIMKGVTAVRNEGDTLYIPSINGGFSEVLYASDGTNPSWDSSAPFVCGDSLLVSNNFSKYFSLIWDAKNDFNLVESSINKDGENVLKVTPLSKRVNGNSKNFISAKLIFNAETEITNKIHEENILIEEAKQEIRKIQYNIEALNSLQQTLRYYRWVAALNEMKSLFAAQTKAVAYLKEMLDDSIKNLNDLMSSLKKIKGKEIVEETCQNFLSDLNNLNNIVSATIDKIKKLDGVNYTMETLSLIDTDSIGLSDQEIISYTDKLGFEVVLKLKDMIRSINQGIEQTNIQITELKQESLSNYKQLYLEIKNQNFYFRDSSLIFDEYRNFVDNYQAYVNKIDTITSYVDMNNFLDGLYKNVFQNVFDKDDTNKILIIKKEIINKYNKLIQDQQEIINISEEKNKGYKELLNLKDVRIFHYKPIVMLLNRYEMSDINGWDGNKLDIDDNGTYILAPKMGAGIKEEDNSFTGVVMGTKNITAGALNEDGAKFQVGLFGFSKGRQSFLLDSRKGAAIFGIAGGVEGQEESNGGQIIIDPSSANGEGRGCIYSGNYWKKYDEYGYPIYSEGPSGRGMIIDFATPEIKFGSGAFTVDKNGTAHIGGNGNGDIGGWNITDSTLYSQNYKRNAGICLDAKNDSIIFGNSGGKIYSGDNETIDTDHQGFHLSKDGLSLTSSYKTVNGHNKTSKFKIKTDGTPVIYSNSHSMLSSTYDGFYIGNDGFSLGSKCKITSEGAMYLGTNATEAGTDREVRHSYWSINTISEANVDTHNSTSDSYIAYKTFKWIEANSDNSTKRSVYLGTNGLTIGERFSVNENGKLMSKSGEIGGWLITSKQLASSQGGITLKANGSILGSPSNEDKDTGEPTSYNWSISKGGVATFNKLIANKNGSIAGWKISSTGLKANNIRIGSEGDIICTHKDGGWSIKSDGSATFSNLTANGKGNIAGWSISSDGLSGNGITMKSGEIYGITDKKTNWSITSEGATFNNLTVTGGSIKLGGFILDENGFYKEKSTTKPGKGSISADINGGTIGGWTIGAKTIKGGDITLDSKGTITINYLTINKDGIVSDNWDILKDSAKFNKVSVTTSLAITGGENNKSPLTIGGIDIVPYVTSQAAFNTAIKNYISTNLSITHTNPTVTDSTGKACTVSGGGATLTWKA